TFRRVQPEAEIWFSHYRRYIVGLFASFGPASVISVLPTAFFKYWEHDLKSPNRLHRLSDGLLYALGRRGALSALHGMAMPDDHQRLTMIYLALGAFHADERFDNAERELLLGLNQDLKQEVASICMAQFGLSEEEAWQCVHEFRVDIQKR